ncbi:hypothetical protein ACLOJK_013701 [Asimina triloba]
MPNSPAHLPFAPDHGLAASEVKRWIQSVDKDKDGRISKEELQAALKGLKLWFTRHRSGRAMKKADKDCNGFIDSVEEFKEFENFVREHWEAIISATA